MPGNPNPDQSNLKPFKKGQSGNPKGRPKLPDLKQAIAKVLAEEKDGMDALEAVLKALRAKAIKGDVRAAQELLDRGFGRAKQIIDVESKGEHINKFDPTKFTDDDLRTIAELQRKSGIEPA